MSQRKRKDGTFEPDPTCFASESDSHGFAFHLKGGIRMFAHHSFLMRIEIKNGNEICFYYTYGVVRVLGRKLEMIYNLALPRVLGSVRPSTPNDPCRDEIEVTSVSFEATESTFVEGL